MKLLSRLRTAAARLGVGQQLFCAFSIVLLMAAASGVIALGSLQRVNTQAGVLAGKWLEGVGLLAEARAAIVESRDFEIRHSRTDDRSYQSEYEEKMGQAASRVVAAMKQYQKQASGNTEQELLAAFSKSWSAYAQVQKKVVGLGRDKKKEDASDISDGLGSTTFDETTGYLEHLTKFNFAGAKSSAGQAQADYLLAMKAVAGLLGATLTLGLAMAWAITRHLLAQLGGEPARAASVAKAVAEGQLNTPIPLKAGDSSSLMAQLKSMQESLAGVVSNVRLGADSVATASGQIAQGNQDLSRRTEQQGSSLQLTASSMEELSTTVRQNAGNARQANHLAQSASEVAVRGGEVVSRVVDTMKGINDSSRKIADIIGVIDSIAFQTNILALNAAVEAARAGEQGRGFAVVASEVRSLAGRSADAAREIKGLISASVERVEQGTALVNQAGTTMTEVVNSIQRVTGIMGEISAASAEQAAGVAQVGEAVTQMDRATQQNAALVEQSAAAAESLKSQAEELVQAVAVFQLTGNGEPSDATAHPASRPMPAIASTARQGRKTGAADQMFASSPRMASITPL